MTNLATSKSHVRCRICGSAQLFSYLNQGELPLANAYRRAEELDEPEFREELMLQVCVECGLSQLSKVVQPDRMFGTYLYTSSVSATFRAHCRELAQTVSGLLGGFRPSDLVVDIASNDGCLLREFQRYECSVLGIDPAENLAREANAQGITTRNAYWSATLAASLDKATVITATNVLGHVDDVDDFVRGVSLALNDRGIFVVECPYVLDFLEHTEFDTVYHEHLSYFGVRPLRQLMAKHGLELFDVRYFPDLHGGTIRSYASWPGRHPVTSVESFVADETDFGLTTLEPYRQFTLRTEQHKQQLLQLFADLSDQVIWAYGASAKGITLLNCLGIDQTTIRKVIDDTPAKQHLYLPGTRIEIVGGLGALPPDVDYLLLMAWNFKHELMVKCEAAGYRGRFIVPIPEPTIV